MGLVEDWLNEFRSNPVFQTFRESLGLRTAITVQQGTTDLTNAADAFFYAS